MTTTGELPEALEAACKALQRIGKPAEAVAWKMLSAVTESASTLEPVQRLKRETGLDNGDELERLLLWHAVQRALPQISALPVEQSVRILLEKELRQLLFPKLLLVAGSYEFGWAAKVSTLRRFPAGPMDWEYSGIPRSWLLKPSFPDNVRLAWFVATRLKGHQPCFFMHVAPNPRKRALVLEKEVMRSYYRMARSLELQPDMRALIALGWFHDPEAVRANPHLEALNRPYLQHGGIITTIGPAPENAGFLEGNAKRKEEYEAGKLKYRMGLAIWPRKAAIDWANAHPEFAS